MEIDHPNCEILIAFADDELTGADLKAAQKLVEEDSAAAEYVAWIRESANLYAEAFASELDVDVPQGLIEKIQNATLTSQVSRPAVFSRFPRSAVATLFAGLLLGAVGMYFGNSLVVKEATPDWIAQVANYQRLYVRPTIDGAPKVDEHTLNTLTNSNLGIDVNAPNLEKHGLAFKRGQLLQVNGQPLVQFAYLPKQGIPVALCITRGQPTGHGDVAYGESHGLAYSAWQQGPLSFMLVGELKEEDIRALTESAMQQLTSS